ncbi:hypothetical protein [Rhodopirellula bahusiensis]|uniref:hypothetical protein n=1 Tax=Rhodopirellula bahusiensis TaxID=2014065 RepID=UPI0032635A97
MNKFRFVRKNGKVLGPLTADRIDHLFSHGKLATDDELGEHQDGPWQSVARLQERIERTKRKKQAEAEQRRASRRSDPSEVSAMPDINEPAQHHEPSDSPNSSAGLPDFPDPLAPTGSFDPVASTAPPAFAAVPTSPRGPARTKARSPDRSGEELDATDPMRWIFPWKWETDTQPYPMLVVYLKFSRAILTLFYLLFMLLGFFYLAFMGYGALRTAGDATSSLPLILTLFGIAVFALFWWLAAQLIYIAGMASIDVLRCFLAIERNSRQ